MSARLRSAPLWLVRTVIVIFGAAAGIIVTPLAVIGLRHKYIDWRNPHYHWDFDFSGIAFIIVGAGVGLLLGTVLGCWVAFKLKDEPLD